jgi:hypothetical protein
MQTDQTTATVFACLKKHGQLLDSALATATGIAPEKVRAVLDALAAKGEISTCSVTRYIDGKAIEGIQCRISGYAPPAAPGRKPSSGAAPASTS